jgi:hypothetical protein
MNAMYMSIRTWPKLQSKWRVYNVYLFTLLIFLASRMVVAVGIGFGMAFIPLREPMWEACPDWYCRLLRWDSGYYIAIATHGYPSADDLTVAFYPLYPLLSRAVAALFGIEEYLALLLVANFAAVIAVLLMTKLAVQELGAEIAVLSLVFFSFYPSSLYLSAGYTEPLCLALVLLSFMLLTQDKFVFAAFVAGLALGTRSTGIVMIPVILWEMWQKKKLRGPPLLLNMALCAVLASSGLLAYMTYLWIKFGQPLAFVTVQAHWHSGTLLDRLWHAVTLAPVWDMDFPESAWFACFLALTIWSFRRLRTSLSLYAFGTLLLPYLTLGLTASMNRFMLMCFPGFMCLGLIMCGKRPWLISTIIGIFGALLFGSTALFSQVYWAG